MFEQNSPFLNIPEALDKKQAIFIDGLRHAAQIANLAYVRLCTQLTDHAVTYNKSEKVQDFTSVFLDAWAFVDAADRFRSLWQMQPESESIAEPYSTKELNEKFKSLRDVRNVSAHIAQKIDQIVALNSTALGSLSWVSAVERNPPIVKTCFIRSGIVPPTISTKFSMPHGDVRFTNHTGWVTLTAGKHEVVLSVAYHVLMDLVDFAENSLKQMVHNPALKERSPSDVFGIAELRNVVS